METGARERAYAVRELKEMGRMRLDGIARRLGILNPEYLAIQELRNAIVARQHARGLR